MQIGPATVTDSLGTARTYQFTYQLGVPKVSSITQSAASGVGTVSEYIDYDGNSNVISRTDFKGNLTCYAYDSPAIWRPYGWKALHR